MILKKIGTNMHRRVQKKNERKEKKLTNLK